MPSDIASANRPTTSQSLCRTSKEMRTALTATAETGVACHV